MTASEQTAPDETDADETDADADAAQEIEFDLLASWTEDAVRELGPEYAIPAGCRGSGSPSDLAWLAEALVIGQETRVVDVGSGVGGPAGWLADHFGARPVCVEPMRSAAAAGGRLFGLPIFVARGPMPGPLPEGNDFPTEEALTELLEGAGFTVVQSMESDGLTQAPVAWQDRADDPFGAGLVAAVLRDRFGDDGVFLDTWVLNRRGNPESGLCRGLDGSAV